MLSLTLTTYLDGLTVTWIAALRYELGDEHSYEFVQGTVPWPMATGKAQIPPKS